MQLADLVQTSLDVGATRRRKLKAERLAELLRRLEGEERPIGAWFLAGQPRQGKLGIGYAAVRTALETPASASPSLSLLEVDARLGALGALAGAGSATRRREGLGALFAAATEAEQSFLARLLTGELRQGALEGVLVEATALATNLSPERVRRARMLAGDIGTVVEAALVEGGQGLERFALTPLSPIHPMLAQTATELSSGLEKLGTAALEWKLDGARVQIHKEGEEVRVFSRRLNEVTLAVPEVVEFARRLPVRRAILDGETIALRPDGRPLPFQTTMRRYGRKLDVERMRAELPLSVFAFDALLVDDEVLLDAPARRRQEALVQVVASPHRVPRLETSELERAESFVAEALAAGHEGTMLKSLDAPYEAGHRGAGWLKLKPAHTLDLVVIAAEWGSGRRSGWLSNLHLACRDPDGARFWMLGKTFKGLSDALLTWQTEALLAREIGREGHVVHVRPELVAEIAIDGLQASPHYPAGLALRFARVKSYREDKTAADATTLDEVRALAPPSSP